jgi:hypothetical protein
MPFATRSDFELADPSADPDGRSATPLYHAPSGIWPPDRAARARTHGDNGAEDGDKTILQHLALYDSPDPATLSSTVSPRPTLPRSDGGHDFAAISTTKHAKCRV